MAGLQARPNSLVAQPQPANSSNHSAFLPAFTAERISTAGSLRRSGRRVVAQSTPAQRGRQVTQASAPIVCFTDVSAAEEANLVEVRFSTHFQAAFGEQLKLVGSHRAVGEWDVAAAPAMLWTDGHMWKTSVTLPEGTEFEYKVVHIHYNGINWEANQNRQLKVAAEAEAARLAAIDVVTAWNQPQPLKVGVVTADDAQQDANLADTNAVVESGDQSAAAWDPSATGLPADLTAELGASAAKPVSFAESFGDAVRGVTDKVFGRTSDAAADKSTPEPASAELASLPEALTELASASEPLSLQAAALDLALPTEAPAEPVVPAALSSSMDATNSMVAEQPVAEGKGAAEPINFATELSKATAVVALASQALEKELAGVTFTVEQPGAEAEDDPESVSAEDESTLEETSLTVSDAAPAPAPSLFNNMGKAAGYAALGLAATVVMSALAIDITDAAIASAVVAAGAAVLPASTSTGSKKAHRGKGGAGDAAVGAIALGMGAADRLAAALKAKNTPRGTDDDTDDDGWAAAEHDGWSSGMDASLAASIAEAEALLAATRPASSSGVAQAKAFAEAFSATPDQLVRDYGITTLPAAQHEQH